MNIQKIIAEKMKNAFAIYKYTRHLFNALMLAGMILLIVAHLFATNAIGSIGSLTSSKTERALLISSTIIFFGSLLFNHGMMFFIKGRIHTIKVKNKVSTKPNERFRKLPSILRVYKMNSWLSPTVASIGLFAGGLIIAFAHLSRTQGWNYTKINNIAFDEFLSWIGLGIMLGLVLIDHVWRICLNVYIKRVFNKKSPPPINAHQIIDQNRLNSITNI